MPTLSLVVTETFHYNPDVPRFFITFEGVEGSGKSTQLPRVAEAIAAQGHDVVVTKEPGGTPISDRIRAILLDPANDSMDATTELLLYAASRRQHVSEKILPALEHGTVVVCDRFADATLAYQGFGRLLDLDRLRLLNDWATSGLTPDLTLLFDIDEEKALTRARSRNESSIVHRDEGRFEAEDLRFHRRVREGYLTLAEAEPARWAVIDADASPDEVLSRALDVLGRRASHIFLAVPR